MFANSETSKITKRPIHVRGPAARKLASLVLVIAAGITAGCGAETKTVTETTATTTAATVPERSIAKWLLDLAVYSEAADAYLAGTGGLPDDSIVTAGNTARDRLIAACRAAPDGIYTAEDGGRTMVQVLTDAAEDNSGVRAVAAQLRAAARLGCR